MREYNEVGLKGPDDILECMHRGAAAYDIHELHGEYVAGMIANVADDLFQQLKAVRAALRRPLETGSGARSYNEIELAGVDWLTQADFEWLLSRVKAGCIPDALWA